VRPAQIRVRNAEVVVLAGGDESATVDGAADGAADVTVKDDAAQTLDNSQMSWVYSLVTQAFANLIVDINSLTFRVEMLRRVPAEADPAAAAAGDVSAAAALEPQRPRHAERRRRCRLSLQSGQVVEATAAGFGPTIEVLTAAAHIVASLAALADPPLVRCAMLTRSAGGLVWSSAAVCRSRRRHGVCRLQARPPCWY
jgi:hypothetical protein